MRIVKVYSFFFFNRSCLSLLNSTAADRERERDRINGAREKGGQGRDRDEGSLFEIGFVPGSTRRQAVRRDSVKGCSSIDDFGKNSNFAIGISFFPFFFFSVSRGSRSRVDYSRIDHRGLKTLVSNSETPWEGFVNIVESIFIVK